MKHYQFFQNRDCEFFPCHKGVPERDFNCLFCYCPLYALGEQCGGHFRYTSEGIKDCSDCSYPHLACNFDGMMCRMNDVLKLAKRKDNASESP